MILRRFPFDTVSSRQGGRGLSPFGRRNVVVYARSRCIAYEEHTAPLSIKATLKGREFYEVRGVPVAVDESSYLVLNDEQPYASHIRSDEDVESFCVFFRHGLEREVSAPHGHSHEGLLDNPEGRLGPPVTFSQTLRRHGGAVSALLGRLHAGITRGVTSQLWLDEQFNSIMEALLESRGQLLREADGLSYARRATRVEVYERLCRARDYVESCYYEPISLPLLARVACLSPHHFLRLFKEAFRLTPHRYLTDVRLREARRLIEERGRPVADACLSVGFENPSSFARLFKQRFGCPPRSLRPAAKK